MPFSFDALGTLLSSVQKYFTSTVPQATLYPLAITLVLLGAIAQFSLGWTGLQFVWGKSSILGQMVFIGAGVLGFLFLAYALSTFQSTIERLFQGQWHPRLVKIAGRLARHQDRWSELAHTIESLHQLHGAVDRLSAAVRAAGYATAPAHAFRAGHTLNRYAIATARDVTPVPIDSASRTADAAEVLTGTQEFQDALVVSPIPAGALIPASSVCTGPDATWIAGMAMLPIPLLRDRVPRDLAAGDVIELFNRHMPDSTRQLLNPGGSRVMHIEDSPASTSPLGREEVLIVTIAVPPEHIADFLPLDRSHLVATLRSIPPQALPVDGVLRTRRWLETQRLHPVDHPDRAWEPEPGQGADVVYSFDTRSAEPIALGTVYPLESVAGGWIVALPCAAALRLGGRTVLSTPPDSGGEPAVTIPVPVRPPAGSLSPRVTAVLRCTDGRYLVLFDCPRGERNEGDQTVLVAKKILDDNRCSRRETAWAFNLGPRPETWRIWANARKIVIDWSKDDEPSKDVRVATLPLGTVVRVIVAPAKDAVVPTEQRVREKRRRRGRTSGDVTIGDGESANSLERTFDPSLHTREMTGLLFARSDKKLILIIPSDALIAPTDSHVPTSGWVLRWLVPYEQPAHLLTRLEAYISETRKWEHAVRTCATARLGVTDPPNFVAASRALSLLQMVYQFPESRDDSKGFKEHLQYWHEYLRTLLHNASRETFYRYDQALKHFHLYYPRDASALASTAVGNIQRAVDAYCRWMYGLDAVLVLPRLAATLEGDALTSFQSAKQQLDFLEWSYICSLVVAVFGGGMAIAGRKPDLALLIWFLLPLALWVIYKSVINAALGYADTLRLTVDFQRAHVLSKLGFDQNLAGPIDSQKEKQLWDAIWQWWELGRSPTSYTLVADPPAPSPPSQGAGERRAGT